MDFPILDLMDQEACYQQARRPAPPRRPGLPPLRRRARRLTTSTAATTAPRSSTTAAGLPPGLQRLHRHALAGDPPQPRRDPADPPRLRPGRPHRPAGPRAGCEPPAPAGAAAPAPGPRGGRLGPPAAAGRPRRGRRDVPERGGKKGSRTPTRTTRRGGGPTRRPGHGTCDTDRPPVSGVAGRASGRLPLRVGRRNWAAELVHRRSCRGRSPGRRCTPTSGAGTSR